MSNNMNYITKPDFRFFIVAFADLKEDKQKEIIESIKDDIVKNIEEYPYYKDGFSIADYITTKQEAEIILDIASSCYGTFCEWPIPIK